MTKKEYIKKDLKTMAKVVIAVVLGYLLITSFIVAWDYESEKTHNAGKAYYEQLKNRKVQ